MTQPADQAAQGPRRLFAWLWILGLLLAVYALGYVGFLQYRPLGSVQDEYWWDLAYFDLQLFGLEFNANTGGVPLALQIARVLAPITFAGAVVSAVVLVRASLWWRRTVRRGFALVVGDTPEAKAVVDAMRDALGLGRGAVFGVVSGDLTALRDAGVNRARTVFAIGDDREDVAANVATALAAVAVRPRRRRPGPRIFVHVTDPELAIGLRARRLMTDAGQRVEFFTMDEMAARAFVEGQELGPDARPEILVAGAGAFGRAVVVAFARHWRRSSNRAGERVTVILVDEHASRAREELLDRWTIVADSCDITAVDTLDLEAALRTGVAGRPWRSYLCYEDEHLALRSALAAVPLWHGGPGSLVVRLSRISRHQEAFQDGRLLDHLGGRLVVANVAALAAPYVAREPDIFEDLARSVHARYLAAQLAKGEALGSRPALRSWEELAQVYQDSNYDQARDFANKLRVVGATVAPQSAANPRLELTAEEVETLAPLEHARWMREREAGGWRFGPTQDADRKVTPDLVPWETLREESREKDREAVRSLQTTFEAALADLGLQIVRL